MTDAIDPARRSASERRLRGRRKTDGSDPAAQAGPAAGASAAAPSAAPAPVGAAGGPAPEAGAPALSAHLLGQGDAPPKAVQRARAAYLEVEWSGGADRRTRRGRIAKTDV
jgi:hypothetical protein